MLSAAARPYIDASVAVLRQHGHTISQRFYQSMFAAHPELNNLFNLGNQASGAQPQSLAASVLAYASHIDQPDALAPVLERIVHKHAAVGITPAHYPIVGRHLLGAIQEVLGEAASPALMAAWHEAYWLLAGELIAAEARLYQRVGQTPGALQRVRVLRREADSAGVDSWYLQTEDGRSPGGFIPGQYVSVAAPLSANHRQLRQYSLSDSPGAPHWRLTIKREAGSDGAPAGQVSNWLHQHVQVGDVLSVSAAFGDFQPRLDDSAPLVLISAGVGVTPMLSVLAELAARGSQRPLYWLYACRDGRHHVLRQAADAALAQLPQARRQVCYQQPQASDRLGADYQHGGLLDLRQAPLPAELSQGDYYLCGPAAFMRAQWQTLLALGAPAARIHREVFGPELLDHLLD